MPFEDLDIHYKVPTVLNTTVDKVHNEILEMSDMLTHGIVKQFPDNLNNRLPGAWIDNLAKMKLSCGERTMKVPF